MKKVIVLLNIILIAFLLSSCVVFRAIDINYYRMEKKYYSDKDNFQTFTGEFVGFSSDDKKEYIHLHIKGWNTDYPNYTESFKIERGNYDFLIESSFLDKLEIGDTITFISAPRIFGDGYSPPIVAISIDGEWILDFDTGYDNLMEKYKLYIFY